MLKKVYCLCITTVNEEGKRKKSSCGFCMKVIYINITYSLVCVFFFSSFWLEKKVTKKRFVYKYIVTKYS